MRPATIEDRVRDYLEAERARVPVPPVVASRILHAVDASRPARKHPRAGVLQFAAGMAFVLLIATGIAWMRTAQMPAGVVNGAWSSVASMGVGRGYHTATLLPNGKVLVVAGSDVRILASAQLYDPRTRTWSSAGMLSTPRTLHTATLLKSGKVLVVGGSPVQPYYLGSLASAELYDPQTNSWTSAASMHTPRSDHTATLLADGRVLVVGGIDASNDVSGTVLSSAELYDPVTNRWAMAAPMPLARAKHRAILLPDHRVLILGGTDTAYVPTGSDLRSAALYDPASQSWSSVASMKYARTFPTATLLPDGRVLVVGDDGVNERTAEIFDPQTDGWSPVPDPRVGRAEHVAVGLNNGTVLVAGGVGETSAQLFDWRRNAWTNAGALTVDRASATATLLPDGRVLIAGGFGDRSVPWASAEVYDPLGTSTVGIRSTRTAPAPEAGAAILLGTTALLLAPVLWLRRRRALRESGAGHVWID
ncbi:MAG TPA: kelch repeat-containing protein [Candidatus Dormibacteraeota bacterium]